MLPLIGGSPSDAYSPMTPDEAVQSLEPLAKFGFPTTFAVAVQVPPPPDELIVQVKDAEPDAPVVSLAVTVTLPVPAVVGVPEIRPELELMDRRPAGRWRCRSASGRRPSQSR